MIRPVLTWLAVLSLALLVACGSNGNKRSPRDQALYEYAGAIRWSEFEVALEFVDPAVREARPLNDLERERFKQVSVSGYEVKRLTEAPDGSLLQVVEIRLVNKHTQTERVITDRQTWRWDAEAKRWWLTSGLPRIVED